MQAEFPEMQAMLCFPQNVGYEMVPVDTCSPVSQSHDE